MRPDFTLTLGGIAFERFEVPETLPFGGDQMVSVHQMVGGQRVIDVMGAVPRDPSWSGLFQGSNALARARALDELRKAGKPIKLTWSEFAYTVVIQKFEADVQRLSLIPYTISLIVTEDQSASKADAAGSIDGVMKSDAQSAFGYASQIGNAGLLSAVTAVRSAVANVSRFATATQAAIASVAAPIEAARELAGSLINQFDDVAQSVDVLAAVGLGGIDVDLDTIAGAIPAQALAATQLTNLYACRNALGRMSVNLDAVKTSGARIVQAGGDLYRIAADNYGDATAWVDIAQANQLIDPLIQGVQELRLPAASRASDGLFG